MRQACLDHVYELAKRDERVVFVGSDLGAGVLQEMKEAMPHRFLMEGVAEQNLIGLAAGLAMDGFVPYVNTIATFLTRRCYEQVAIDLCLHGLPVRLIGNGGGMVYAPLGPTHMAIEDIAIMRALPGMTVVAPADAPEMVRLMERSLDLPGPLYIRVAKGRDPVVSDAAAGFEIGRGIVMRTPGRVAAVATGITTARALEAADILAGQGVAMGVLHLHTLKPLDGGTLAAFVTGADLVVTVEEHSRIGGLGSAVLEQLSDGGVALPVLRLALPDAFPDDYGSQDHLLERAGLQAPQIAERVVSALSGRPERPRERRIG